MGQVAKAVFSGFHPGVVLVSIVAGLILILAANTAFNGFPVLGSILAKDGYLPRQLHTRGDRLAFSNGILILAGAAALLIFLYDAEVTKLIQLYIVGVFVSFTLSQIGMIRHWNRHLTLERDPGDPATDDAQPRHQRRRCRHVRHGAAGRAGHQVHPRRGLRHRGDDRAVLHHAADPATLRAGARGAAAHRRRRRGADAPEPRARDRAGLQDPQADPARARLRPRDPARPSSRRSRSTSSPTRPRRCRRSGTAATSRCRSRRWTRRTARSPARSSSTSSRSGPAIPRDVVVVYIPEYVLGSGTSRYCTTRAPCGSRAGCCSPPGSWWPACPGSWPRRRARRSGSTARPRARSGSASERGADGPVGGRRRRARGGCSRPRRVLRGPARRTRRLRPSHACPANGSEPASPRRATVSASCAPMPSRCCRPVRAGSPRRARMPVPGLCGGCDFQHTDLGHQRELKAAVVREQFSRLAKLDVDVVVEPVRGDEDGTGWRTRVEFAVDDDGRAGLRAHRSHVVVPVETCLIAHPRVLATGVLGGDWTGERAVDVVAPSTGEPVVVPVPSGRGGCPLRSRNTLWDKGSPATSRCPRAASGRCTQARRRRSSMPCSTCSNRSPVRSPSTCTPA